MADLVWFPFFAKSWLSSPARMAMLPEQRGAYIDLLAFAWGEGDVMPSLPCDDATLAALSGLGRRWGKLGALVRAQFQEQDGLLYNAKLTEVWFKQQERYQRRAKAGKAGGNAKANSKQTPSIATATGKHKEIEREEAVEPFQALPASAPVGALAPEAPRAPAPLAKYVQPPEQPDPNADARAMYRERLIQRVDEWCARNPDDALALEEAARQELPPLMRQQPTPAMKRVMRERVILEVSKRNPSWPTEDQFIAQQRLAAMEVA